MGFCGGWGRPGGHGGAQGGSVAGCVEGHCGRGGGGGPGPGRHLQQKQVVVYGVRPAVRVWHRAEHVIALLGGFRLRQRVGAQEHLHRLPWAAGGRTGQSGDPSLRQEQPGAPDRATPPRLGADPSLQPQPHSPGPQPHSHVLQAVGGTQHPLLGHQESPTHVLAIHLHRHHVGAGVGP